MLVWTVGTAATVGGAHALLMAAGSPAEQLNTIFSFAQFGLLGLFFLALVSKHWVVPKWSLDDIEEAHRRELTVKDEIIEAQRLDVRDLKEANAELQRLTQERIIPALVQATGVMQSYVSELANRRGS